jgi:hypothetical protein
MRLWGSDSNPFPSPSGTPPPSGGGGVHETLGVGLEPFPLPFGDTAPLRGRRGS